MNDLLSMMARHGYALTFVVLFAEAMGFPFPAAIALVAAGAATASHTLSGTGVLSAAMIALMIGDIAQFWLGRYTGWALLGFL
jgi:membrane protein DedA with SNARE-associated domain